VEVRVLSTAPKNNDDGVLFLSTTSYVAKTLGLEYFGWRY
jgi:hypothetical protein